MMTIPNTAKAANVRISVAISLNIFNVLASYYYIIMLVSAALRLASLFKDEKGNENVLSLTAFVPNIKLLTQIINLHSQSFKQNSKRCKSTGTRVTEIFLKLFSNKEVVYILFLYRKFCLFFIAVFLLSQVIQSFAIVFIRLNM